MDSDQVTGLTARTGSCMALLFMRGGCYDCRALPGRKSTRELEDTLQDILASLQVSG